MAAEKPNTTAITAQRNGHGRWRVTMTRGALIDRRRRNSFQRMRGADPSNERGRMVAACLRAGSRELPG
jgi:hypothetical protein